jgi:hypothetical protein
LEVNRNKYTQSVGRVSGQQYSYKLNSAPPPPTSLLAESGSLFAVNLQGGSVINQILVSYRRPANVLVSHFELQWQR